METLGLQVSKIPSELFSRTNAAAGVGVWQRSDSKLNYMVDLFSVFEERFWQGSLAVCKLSIAAFCPQQQPSYAGPRKKL